MSDAPLEARGLVVGYDGAPVIDALDLLVPNERITAIVGANGCGKSTLLRALALLIPPRQGTVLLDGRSIRELPSREVARQLGMLPQSPVAPDSLTVEDLVARGRYPHRACSASGPSATRRRSRRRWSPPR
jgi:iron complex transport system ATP-binding protein